MAHASPGPRPFGCVRDRPHWRDVLWILWGGIAIAAGTGMLVEHASVKEVLSAVGAILLFGIFPVLKVVFLLRGQMVAQISRTGIKLFDERGAGLHWRSSTARVDLRWSEVRRLVLWHQTEWQGGVRYRSARLGVELRNNGPAAASMSPTGESESATLPPLKVRGVQALQMTETLRQAFRNLHREGVPDHVGDDLVSHSVAFSASGRRRIAAAISEVGARVEFLDARKTERLRPIKPRRR